jgi:hypothetical protein
VSFLDIDFAAPRGPSLPVSVGLIAVLLLLASGGYRALRQQQALDAVQAQLARHRQEEVARATVPAPQRPVPDKERVKAVNEAIGSLNVPWPSILAAVETALPSGVALMRVEPRPADRVVLLTAQADDMAPLLDFMATLSSTAPFTRTRPVRQEQLADATGARKQATFEVRWEAVP